MIFCLNNRACKFIAVKVRLKLRKKNLVLRQILFFSRFYAKTLTINIFVLFLTSLCRICFLCVAYFSNEHQIQNCTAIDVSENELVSKCLGGNTKNPNEDAFVWFVYIQLLAASKTLSKPHTIWLINVSLFSLCLEKPWVYLFTNAQIFGELGFHIKLKAVFCVYLFR